MSIVYGIEFYMRTYLAIVAHIVKIIYVPSVSYFPIHQFENPFFHSFALLSRS